MASGSSSTTAISVARSARRAAPPSSSSAGSSAPSCAPVTISSGSGCSSSCSTRSAGDCRRQQRRGAAPARSCANSSVCRPSSYDGTTVRMPRRRRPQPRDERQQVRERLARAVCEWIAALSPAKRAARRRLDRQRPRRAGRRRPPRGERRAGGSIDRRSIASRRATRDDASIGDLRGRRTTQLAIGSTAGRGAPR